jgi:hypothetical protein
MAQVLSRGNAELSGHRASEKFLAIGSSEIKLVV